MAKLPPRLPIPSPITKIRGFSRHLLGQGLERRLHVGELAAAGPAAAVLADAG